MSKTTTDTLLREQLLHLLKGGNAHMTLDEAVAGYPAESMNTLFPNGDYSSWHLLEHIRLSQWDILDFIRNPEYQELEWPKDYWPPQAAQASDADWKETLASFQRDMQALQAIALDPQIDLHARIPWGTGQTVLRELLLVADHNAYHIGEFAIMRQVMGTWGSKR
jgi:DinB superfamily